MKKNILIFGLIAGLISSTMMAITAKRCYEQKDFEGSMILGFTVMIIAFSFIFVAIKNYRDKFNAGVISFGGAFKIGILIALIGSTIYVVSWLIIFYNFFPDFMDKFTAHQINELKTQGLSAVETNKEIAKMNNMKEMYSNPLGVILLTYMEIFPVGLIVSIICALILKKRNKLGELAN